MSAKRGPDSIFVDKANTKSWRPKSSRSRIVKLMDQCYLNSESADYSNTYSFCPFCEWSVRLNQIPANQGPNFRFVVVGAIFKPLVVVVES